MFQKYTLKNGWIWQKIYIYIQDVPKNCEVISYRGNCFLKHFYNQGAITKLYISWLFHDVNVLLPHNLGTIYNVNMLKCYKRKTAFNQISQIDLH